jgi:hypothetical protein
MSDEEYDYPNDSDEDAIEAPELGRQDSYDYTYESSDDGKGNRGGSGASPQLVSDCDEFNDILRLHGLTCGHCRPGR